MLSDESLSKMQAEAAEHRAVCSGFDSEEQRAQCRYTVEAGVAEFLFELLEVGEVTGKD